MKKLSWGGKSFLGSVAGAAAVAMFSTGAQASPVSVTNQNSTITVDPTSATGMTSWTIDGVNILGQQSFFYRIGSGNNVAVSTIGAPTVSANNGILETTYTTASFSMDILYSLKGSSSGSGISDVSEQITIQNLSASAINNFHFYQYADFLGSGNVDLTKNGRGLYNEAYVTANNLSVNESLDTVVTPANHGETLANTLANITGIANYTLADNLSSSTTQWGVEWDRNLNAFGTPGSSVIISKDLGAAIVPEPSTWSLLSVGLALGAFQWYRRKAGRSQAA